MSGLRVINRPSKAPDVWPPEDPCTAAAPPPSLIQGVCRQSAKAKLKNRHFNGVYRGSKPFFLTLQTGLKFPVDKRSIKDA